MPYYLLQLLQAFKYLKKKKKVISYHKSTGTCNNVCMITYGLGQVRLVKKKKVFIYIYIF